MVRGRKPEREQASSNAERHARYRGHHGLLAVFGLAAAMHVVFAISIQFGPEICGKSIEKANQPSEALVSPAPGALEFA